MNAYTGVAAPSHVFTTAHWGSGNHVRELPINTDAVSGSDVVLDGWEFPMAVPHRKIVYSRKVIWFLRGAIAFMVLALVSWGFSFALTQEWPIHASAVFFVIAATFLSLWIRSAEHEWRSFTETN